MQGLRDGLSHQRCRADDAIEPRVRNHINDRRHATPVFADVEPDSWCVSAASVEQCVTPRTKAVMPVDLYGMFPDMASLRALADRHGFAIIEDAAQAVGGRLADRPAGSFGDVSAFSFHGTKTLTTGEGGMLVTDRTDVYERALVLRDHGRTKANFRFFYNTEVAFKYRMSNMQAAFGLAQLERLPELVARKRQIFGWYAERLRGVSGLSLNVEPAGVLNTFWMVSIVVDRALGATNRTLMAAFDEHAIDTRPFFHPLSDLPAFSGMPTSQRARARNTVAYDISPRGLNLPSAMNLTEAQVDRVCQVLVDVLERQRSDAR